MTSGEWPEFGQEVGVGEETYVEHEIGVVRNPMFEPKAHARDKDIAAVFFLLEKGGNMCPEFVHIKLRSIDNEIGEIPNVMEMAPLGPKRCLDGGVRAQRMGPSGLTIPAQQHRV